MNIGSQEHDPEMPLNILKRLDRLAEISFEECPGYLHDDHRFVLPLIFSSQQAERLPRPCKIIMFDRHHDALLPRTQDVIAEIDTMRCNGFGLEELIAFCNARLCANDDDWIKAGMGLGLISDGVVFGVEDCGNPDLETFRDSQGIDHRFKILSTFPGPALEEHGELVDLARADEFRPAWDVLEWNHVPGEGFRFHPRGGHILLDIDLDAFVMCWSDYVFPWENEVFEDRFLKRTTQRWNGKQFFRELVSRAGLLTIAREPRCCGNRTKARVVWNRINKFLFDQRLRIHR
jgi:hypothetical protein